jgi:MFS superfamily sulfate permease-like transporter
MSSANLFLLKFFCVFDILVKVVVATFPTRVSSDVSAEIIFAIILSCFFYISTKTLLPRVSGKSVKRSYNRTFFCYDVSAEIFGGLR